MRKRLVWLLALCSSMLVAAAQSKDELAVRKVLEVQAKQWNSGNIDAYMETYWKNDSLLFVGRSGANYGWEKTRANYRKSYPDTASMGKLTFELLQVNRLSVEYFFVVGKWELTRSMGDLKGAFTLLLRKINHRWVIVADHSS